MIAINHLSKSFGPQVLFEDADFLLGSGERVGLVGRNGSGKSTLFKMILKQELADEGEITMPRDYTIGNLEQHIHFSKKTLLEECCQVLKGEAEFDQYKAEKILFGLGFVEEDLNKAPELFSGGYQVRINLAKVLLTEPNLLLLDEPTNYLDIVSVRWLKGFLKSFQGEVILITHDRDFMNDVCTHTVGIVRRKLKKIKGDTTKFFEQLALEDEIYEKTKENHDKRVRELSRFVERFGHKATKAAQAQSKMKMIEKLGTMDELERERLLGFHFNYSECPAKTLIEVNNLSFNYPGGPKLIDNLSFQINSHDRVGIIGKNGKGKSTLLNILAGLISPVEGEVKKHNSIKQGHFGQTNIERLSMNMTIEEEIASEQADLPYSRIRGICGTMMFEGELAKKKISVLSGGERSRVMLGKIIARPTNILMLDEPTNHLDMESIESLAEEIEEYKGAVLIVTHSEVMLERLVNKLIVFHHDKVEVFEGNYQDFLEKIGWDDEVAQVKEVKQSSISFKEAKILRQQIIQERAKILKPLRARVEWIENRITELEGIVDQSNNELVEASNNSDGEKIVSLSKIVSDSENEIEELFVELEEKSEELDTLEKSYNEKLEQLS